MVYSMIVSSITICAVGIFSIKKWCRGRRMKYEAQILIIFAILWVVAAGALSFSGPFRATGNGYFGSWIAAVLSVTSASKAWAQRSE